ncbi:MAG: phosphatidate cytidylyltransferase [Pseudomonadota bacterium]
MNKVIWAIILSVATAAGVLFLPAFIFKISALFLIIGSLVEYSRLVFSVSTQRIITIVVGSVVAVALIFVWPENQVLFVVFAGAVFILALLFMWQTKVLEGVLTNLANSVFAVFYLVLGLAMWCWLRDLPQGQAWVLMTLAGSCLSDSGAYIVGKSFGKHKFAPMVSPNKTIEGFGGALLGSLLGVFIVHAIFIKTVFWPHLLILAVIIWLVSAMGDLVESLIKRSLAVKDSGDLIPGHGGLLDRLDALVFTGPAVFVYVKNIIH